MYRTIAKNVSWEFDSIIMQNLSDILPLFCTPTWPSHHIDFENFKKWNFCKTKFSFPFFKELFPQFIYAELAILKFLRLLFLNISFKLYLGCKVSCCSITHEKSKESFPFGDILSRTFFAYMQPLTSFVSYPASDNKVVIRFLENRGVGRRESISLAFKIPVLS